MEKKDRLAKAIAYLKMQGLVDSQVDAARKMNAAESTMSSAIGGNERYLNNRFLKRFNEAFGNIFSFEWLVNGIGNMLNGCGCTSPDDPSLYGKTPSASGTIGSTEVQRTHNGGTTEAERIKFLEEQVAFYKEQTAYYKEMAERKDKQ